VRFKSVVAGSILAVFVPTQVGANTIQGRGTWETTLSARDVNGHPVPLNSPSAVFFYDSVLNVTWLANMNASAGSAYDDAGDSSDGILTWTSAMRWASALTVGGYSNWRLPRILDTGTPGCASGELDCGFNSPPQVGGNYSEFTHLYYVTLGNLGYCSPLAGNNCTDAQPGWDLVNSATFQIPQSISRWDSYWSSTTVGNDAWFFNFDGGGQGFLPQYLGQYAVAVRDGDVAALPEPASLGLAILAIAGCLRLTRLQRKP